MSPRLANRTDNIRAMHQAPALSPDQVVDDLGPLVPHMYRAIEAGVQEALLFHEGNGTSLDPYLFPSIVRWRTRLTLLAANVEVAEEQVEVDSGLPNNGILMTAGPYTIRLLKADHGEVPAPGVSRPRQDFWAQPLFGQQPFVNLVVIWDYDAANRSVDLTVACPRSSDVYGNVELHFSRRLLHPILTAPVLSAEIDDDLDIRIPAPAAVERDHAG